MRITRKTRPRVPSRRLLSSMLFAVVCAVGSLWAPHDARAQDVDAQVESLVDQASDHYDNLEIDAARKKLEKAVKTGQNQGASNEVIARAYVMVGVVEYGAKREKKRALKAFKEAAKLDPNASIPEVYKTPTLSKLMKKAKESTEPAEKETGTGEGGVRQVDEFTHEPISSAQAGEPLLVEAFVPTDLTVDTVEFVFKRYNQEDEWQRVELKATNATRFATEVPGYRIYTTQIDYYLEVINPSGKVVAKSGSPKSPHQFTVLGNSSFDPEQAKKEYFAKREGEAPDGGTGVEKPTDPGTDVGDKPSGTDGPTAYLDFGGGTGVGILTGGGSLSPTANPGRPIEPGFSSAFAHLRLGGGYMFPNGSQLGLYLRFQFLPAQNFADIRSALAERDDVNRDYRGFRNAPCFGTGLPGDCLLGAKYRWFFTEPNPTQFFSSVGAGVGRVRHWLRLREQTSESDFCEKSGKPIYQDERTGKDFCYRADTVRPGWAHFGVGGGMNHQFSETFSFLAEAYLQVLFPATAVNLDINIGPQFRF